MTAATLEHTNLTVSDPDQSAKTLCDIFNWTIRWSGVSMDEGYTVHVGTDNSYIALYTNNKTRAPKKADHSVIKNINHIGIVVENIELTEQRVLEKGFETINHADYEPGRRFYFLCEDDLEIEVISYQPK